jgi:hypothetical protein
VTIDLASLDDGTLESLGAAVSQALRVVRMAGRANIPLVAEIYQPSEDDSVEFALRPPLRNQDTMAETEGSEAEGPEGADEPAPGPDVAPEPQPEPQPEPVREPAVLTVVHPSPDARPGAVQFHTGMSAAEMDRWIRYHDPEAAQLQADLSMVSALARGEALDAWAAERDIPFTRALRRWKEICPIPTLGTQTLLLEALKRRAAQEAAA